MNNAILLGLKAVNVPSDLCHKTRSEEIAELVKYLQVELAYEGNLGLVNIGQSEPPVENAIFPWFRTDPAGKPVGLYINYGGNWTPLYPYTVGQPVQFSGPVSDVTAPFLFADGTDGTPDLRAIMIKSVSADGTITMGEKGKTESSYVIGYKIFGGYP